MVFELVSDPQAPAFRQGALRGDCDLSGFSSRTLVPLASGSEEEESLWGVGIDEGGGGKSG